MPFLDERGELIYMSCPYEAPESVKVRTGGVWKCQKNVRKMLVSKKRG